MLRFSIFTMTFLVALGAFAEEGYMRDLGTKVVQKFKVEVSPKYRLDAENDGAITFYGDFYTFLSHADPTWDATEQTKPGIQRLAKFSKSQGIDRIGIIGSDKDQFFTPDQSEFNVASAGGNHRLNFPNARHFLVGGGFLQYCLCELLRDTIAGTKVSKDPLNITLVSDAVYSSNGSTPTFNQKTFKNVKNGNEISFTQIFRSPSRAGKVVYNVNQNGVWQLDKQNSINITSFPAIRFDNIVKKDKEYPGLLKATLKDAFTGEDQDHLCPRQNGLGHPTFLLKDFTFNFSVDGKQHTRIGIGNKQVINFNIVHSKNLDREMQRYGFSPTNTDEQGPINIRY